MTEEPKHKDERSKKFLTIEGIIAVADFIRDHAKYNTAQLSDIELCDLANREGVTTRPVTQHNIVVIRKACKISVCRAKHKKQKTAKKSDLLQMIKELQTQVALLAK